MTGRKTILVVEDNELNRLMLCSILNEKYYVLQAENGKIALDILEGNKDKISLILLDMVIPFSVLSRQTRIILQFRLLSPPRAGANRTK